MISGAEFYYYQVSLDSGNVTKQHVQMWFETMGTSAGVLYFCDASLEPRVSHASRSLRLSELTDLYNLHSSKFFSSRHAVLDGSNASRCLTLISPMIELNVEALEDGVVDKFIDGLRIVLSHYGRKIEEEAAAQAEPPASAMAALIEPAAIVAPSVGSARARRLSVLPATPPPASSLVPPGSAASAPAPGSAGTSRRGSALTLSTHDINAQMKKGAPMHRYIWDAATRTVEKSDIWLFYRCDAEALQRSLRRTSSASLHSCVHHIA
jgi:hypothetical protein